MKNYFKIVIVILNVTTISVSANGDPGRSPVRLKPDPCFQIAKRHAEYEKRTRECNQQQKNDQRGTGYHGNTRNGDLGRSPVIRLISDPYFEIAKKQAEYEKRIRECNQLLKGDQRGTGYHGNTRNGDLGRSPVIRLISDPYFEIAKKQAEYEKRIRECNQLLKGDQRGTGYHGNTRNGDPGRSPVVRLISDPYSEIAKKHAEYEKRIRECNQLLKGAQRCTGCHGNTRNGDPGRSPVVTLISDPYFEIAKKHAEYEKRIRECNQLLKGAQRCTGCHVNSRNGDPGRFPVVRLISDPYFEIAKKQGEYENRTRERNQQQKGDQHGTGYHGNARRNKCNPCRSRG